MIVRRDDGEEGGLPVSHFFREPPPFTPIEKAAIELCRRHVLDAGPGIGLHSLALQAKGLQVTSIDVSSEASHVAAKRGVTDVHCADLFDY